MFRFECIIIKKKREKDGKTQMSSDICINIYIHTVCIYIYIDR